MIDQTIAGVIDELERFQEGRGDSWNVPRDEGMMLHVLALACGARRLVEVGTSYGFSGLFLGAAAAANGGMLHTFDRNEAKHEHARAMFRQAGLADAIKLYTGDALERLAELPSGLDFLFLDATKSETHAYWDILAAKLARRCVVTVDNTADMAAEMKRFVDYLHSLDEFSVCHIPCSHGLEVAVRT